MGRGAPHNVEVLALLGVQGSFQLYEVMGGYKG